MLATEKNTRTDNKQLLLVDDDPNLILLVKDYLEFRGYDVIAAESGNEALEILKQKTPDLIICDVMMPDMDGYSLVKSIRGDSKTQSIPVLLLSAKGQNQDRIKGFNTGADIYMTKPFEPEVLVAQIQSFLSFKDRLADRSKLSANKPSHKLAGKVKFTPTELNVLGLLSKGKKNKQIAEQLNVSQRTIESHVSNMLNKTGLNNRTELACLALETVF
ncbi:MAG: response regulator transcription factor [Prochloraceae cyanobacterium]